MYSNVALESVDDIDFQLKEIPTTNNIGMISAINTNQMIAIKAKLLEEGGKKKVKTDDGEKFLVNAFLGDPHGTIKVTLWEPFSDLEEGKTYQFDNLLVRREYNTKDIILATPKTGCKAVETASFKENVIQPSELPKSFTTTTTPAKYLEFSHSLHIMHVANAKRRPLWKNPQLLLVTDVAYVKQKVKSTTEQCYVQLYIDINAAKVTVTVFHDIIKNLLISQGKPDLPIN